MNKVISVKVDAETKAAAQEIAKSVGLNLSALVNSYLKQVVATRRIELYAPETMTPKLESLIAIIEADIEKGKNLSPVFTSADTAMKWLKK